MARTMLAMYMAVVAAMASTLLPRNAPEPETVRMKVTAYCPCASCCGSFSDGRTSIGDDAWIEDGVAAAPELLPYRTRLRIPGVGIREVDDTGGAMRTSARRGEFHIDVRMTSHERALEWGVRYLLVERLGGQRAVSSR